MNVELIMVALMSLGTIIGSISTVLIARIRRPKTEAEAEVNEAQSEKIKAEALMTMYQTVAQSSKDIHAQTQQTIKYIRELDTSQRRIWQLEGEGQRVARREIERDQKIEQLVAQVAQLIQSETALQVQIAELTESKESLLAQTADLRRASREKDDRIHEMSERIKVLEDENSDLNRRLEAKESPGDNGKKATKEVPTVSEKAGKTPPAESDPVESGQ